MRIRPVAGTVLAATLALGLAVQAPAERPASAAGPLAPMLVSSAWLATHLKDPNLVLLHVGRPEGYKAAHIAGARLVTLDDISVSAGGRTLEMPTAAQLRRQLQALGIGDRSRVVLYFQEDWVSPATRVLLALRTAGLGARTNLLDGGLEKWRRERRPVTTSAMRGPRPGTLGAFRLQPTFVDNAFVRAHAGKPGYVLVDARAPVYYNGTEAGGPHTHMKRGHIPGARNVPFSSVSNDDLTFKTPAELRALFRKAGVKPGDRVIAYCHIGQQATAVVYAARAVGIDAVLYDGSFEDWALRDLPVEK